jgi:hypothetical protein
MGVSIQFESQLVNKNNQGQQAGRLKKPKMMESGTDSQHITTEISKVA